MRILLIFLFIFFGCLNAFGCSDAIKPYEFECKVQDRYQTLSNEFQANSITMTNLKGFKIPLAIGKLSYFSAKNDLLNHSEVTLAHNPEWQAWNIGQKFVNNQNPAFIEFSDILKLHKNLFASKNIIDFGSEAGKIRTNNGETNPKISMACSDKTLIEKLFNILIDYDLKSIEGYPLLSLQNIAECKDTPYLSADLYFYKGASVKMELTRWIVDFNDMIARFEKGDAPFNISPYNYLSDMRRWFLAIKPFNAGNEQVVNALMDYSTKRMQLPPLSFSDSIIPIFLTVEENRDNTVKKIQETLGFFEGCLFETKMKLISSECTPLK